MDAFLQLIPMFLLGIPFAIGNYHLAKRVDRAKPILWVISSLVPLLNVLFMYYLFYRVVLQILDSVRANGYSSNTDINSHCAPA
jgi:hypothetical protein